ncbi:MAG: RNA methyltransferase [Bacteroidota bacterium]
MASKKWLSLVKGLHQKKYRNQHQLFFIEGPKAVSELVAEGLAPEKIFVTPKQESLFPLPQTELLSEQELEKISALQHPNGILGVFPMPQSTAITTNNWVVALDDVRDPGNLGTIIRLCDWFGVKDLVCSKTTVDCFNPKVLQATMGSIARVNIIYTSLESYLEQLDLAVYGATMAGVTVYETALPSSGVLLLGNEANGISRSLASSLHQKIAIPQFGPTTAESLNVAMAAGILLSEIRRR